MGKNVVGKLDSWGLILKEGISWEFSALCLRPHSSLKFPFESKKMAQQVDALALKFHPFELHPLNLCQERTSSKTVLSYSHLCIGAWLTSMLMSLSPSLPLCPLCSSLSCFVPLYPISSLCVSVCLCILQFLKTFHKMLHETAPNHSWSQVRVFSQVWH